MGSSLNVGRNRKLIQLFLGRATRRQIFVLLCLSLVISSLARAQNAGPYWPTHSWRTSTPEAQGFDSDALASAFQTIREHNIPIHSLLIERNGYVILDSYFFPFKDGEKHDIASATKSITSTLIGIAIGEGRLAGVEQPVLSVFPDLSISSRDARKERMTIGDFLTMRSGLDCHSEQGELTLTQMRASGHWVPFMLNLPMATDPGSAWVYCSGGMHVLSGVISRVTGRNAFRFAQNELLAPLGIRDVSWPSDPDGVFRWLGRPSPATTRCGEDRLSMAARGKLGGQADSAGGLHARRCATALFEAGIRLRVLDLSGATAGHTRESRPRIRSQWPGGSEDMGRPRSGYGDCDDGRRL
jgi:CubicO group peptidase (beta-lactamase class C family)